MAEFFRVGRYFDTQDAERTRTEQLERQKQELRYLGSTIFRPGMRLVLNGGWNSTPSSVTMLLVP